MYFCGESFFVPSSYNCVCWLPSYAYFTLSLKDLLIHILLARKENLQFAFQIRKTHACTFSNIIQYELSIHMSSCFLDKYVQDLSRLIVKTNAERRVLIISKTKRKTCLKNVIERKQIEFLDSGLFRGFVFGFFRHEAEQDARYFLENRKNGRIRARNLSRTSELKIMQIISRQ